MLQPDWRWIGWIKKREIFKRIIVVYIEWWTWPNVNEDWFKILPTIFDIDFERYPRNDHWQPTITMVLKRAAAPLTTGAAPSKPCCGPVISIIVSIHLFTSPQCSFASISLSRIS